MASPTQSDGLIQDFVPDALDKPKLVYFKNKVKVNG